MNNWWWNMQVSNLSFDKPLLLKENTITCHEAIHIFEDRKSQPLVISNDNVHVKGVIILNKLMSNLISGAVKHTDFVEKTMIKQYVKVKPSTTIGLLSHILEKESHAIILDDERDDAFVGIVNQFHILNLITKNNDKLTLNNSPN